MIDGERGDAITSRVVAMQMDAAFDSDEIMVTLIAACFAYSLAFETSPRQLAESLFEILPGDERWDNGLRDEVERAIEMYPDREAA